ncbi:thiol methyltransferase 1 [Rhodotorula toruloides]
MAYSRPMQPTEALLKVRQFLQEDPTEGQSATGAGWDQAWKAETTPWDAGDVQPALRELLDEKWSEVGVSLDELKDGKALVAGCGRGCDAAFIATHGIDTLGIDLSPTAVEVAKKHLSSQPDAPTNITFEAADFFAFPLPSNKPFSFAFDYTFFCALPPLWREKWGNRYAEVVRPGGLLVCLAFPIDGDREGGPPYSVSEEAYDKVLLANFDKVYSKQPTKMAEGREPGRDRMIVYRRK